MPYGIKQDPSSRWRIDFDDIWHRAFRPAAEAAGVLLVRADEERLGGFVHLALFERLLLAEIVLADLTLASPNVMYELGIRRATPLNPMPYCPCSLKSANFPLICRQYVLFRTALTPLVD